MVDNSHHFCICATRPALTSFEKARLSHQRAAFLSTTKWTETDIRVRFLGGTAALQARVKAVANEWTKIVNLNFIFVDKSPAEIRIAFMPGAGSWSYLGTMCRDIPDPEPTMNYGWLDDATADDEVRRVVLHEFGHAIGLIHEHMNPTGGIVWNKAAVIADLSGPPNNWGPETIQENMFKKYDPSELDATPADPTSIMMYPIPAAWTLNGFSAGLNTELSAYDKQLARTEYPGRL